LDGFFQCVGVPSILVLPQLAEGSFQS
jgi:hypothetical protein